MGRRNKNKGRRHHRMRTRKNGIGGRGDDAEGVWVELEYGGMLSAI